MIGTLLTISVVALSPTTTSSFAPISQGSRAATTSLQMNAFESFMKHPFGPASNGGGNTYKVAVITGATGYIGKSTVRESVCQGYKTLALVLDKKKVESNEGKMLYGTFFEGAEIVECNVCDAEKLTKTFIDISNQYNEKIDTVVSCLASCSGIKKDAYAINYQATHNCLESGRTVGAQHFVLLSAFCTKNPWLQFQQAKLKFEAALEAQKDMTYSIVHPLFQIGLGSAGSDLEWCTICHVWRWGGHVMQSHQ